MLTIEGNRYVVVGASDQHITGKYGDGWCFLSWGKEAMVLNFGKVPDVRKCLHVVTTYGKLPNDEGY